MAVEVLGGALDFVATLDTSELEQGLNSAFDDLQSKVERMNDSLVSTASSVAAAFNAGPVEDMAAKVKVTADSIKNLLIKGLTGSINIDAADLDRVQRQIDGTTDNFEKLRIITGFIQDNFSNLNLNTEDLQSLHSNIDLISEAVGITTGKIADLKTGISGTGEQIKEALDPTIVDELNKKLALAEDIIVHTLNGFEDIDNTKLIEMGQQVESATNRYEKLRITLNFIQENLSHLNLSPDEAVKLTTALSQTVSAMDQLSQGDIGRLGEQVAKNTTEVTALNSELGETAGKIAAAFPPGGGPIDGLIAKIREAGDVIKQSFTGLAGLDPGKLTELTNTVQGTTGEFNQLKTVTDIVKTNLSNLNLSPDQVAQLAAAIDLVNAAAARVTEGKPLEGITEGTQETAKNVQILSGVLTNISRELPAAFNSAPIDGLISKIRAAGQVITASFTGLTGLDPTKLTELTAKVQGTTGEFEQLKVITDILKTNLASLNLSPDQITALAAAIDTVDAAAERLSTGKPLVGLTDGVADTSRNLQTLSGVLSNTSREITTAFSAAPVDILVNKVRSAGQVIQSALQQGLNQTVEIDSSKIEKLQTDLKGAGDEFERVRLITRFLQDNLGQLDLNPEQLGALSQAVSTVNNAIDDTSGSTKELRENLSLTGKDIVKAFTTSGVSAFITKMKDAGATIHAALAKALSGASSIDPASLTGIQNLVKGTTGEFKKLELITGFVKDNLGNLNLSPDEVTALSEAVNTVSTSFGSLVEREQSVRARLREIAEELAKLKAGGDTSSIRFTTLTQEAGELKKNLNDINAQLGLVGSETPGLVALQQGFRGLLGGVQAGAAAIGLFTDDEEQAAQITKNLVAIMSLLNGVEELSAVLSKNSAVNLFLQAAARKSTAVAATEQAVATTASNVASAAGVPITEGATAAQLGLNAAMLANPVAAILAGVVALFGAYKLLSATVFKASSATQRLKASEEAFNEAQKKSAATIASETVELDKLLRTARDLSVNYTDRILALDELKAKSPEYLSSLSLETINTKAANDAIGKQIALMKQRALVAAAEDILKEKTKAQLEAQIKLNKALKEGNIISANPFSGSGAIKSLEKYEEATNEVEGATDTFNQTLDDLNHNLTTTGVNASGLSPILRGLGAAIGQAQSKFNPEGFDKERALIEANYQARVNRAKQGTAAEIAAQRDLVQAMHQKDLQDPRLFDQGTGKAVSPEGIVKDSDFQKQMRELNEQSVAMFLKSVTDSAEAIVITLATAGKEGSEAFFDAQADALRAAAREQIAQANGVAGTIRRINAQLNSDLAKLEIERRDKSLEIDQSILNTKLALVKEGSREELELRLQLIDQAAAKEILAATGNQAKIDEIHAKATRDRAELSKQFDFNQQTIDQDKLLAGIQIELNAERDAFDKRISLRKKEVDINAERSRIEARKTIKDKELLEVTLRKIESDAIKNRKDLDNELSNHILENRIKVIRSINDKKNATLDSIINNPFASQARKDQAAIDKTANEIKALKKEMQLLLDDIAHGRGDFDELVDRFEEAEKKSKGLTDQLKLQNKELSFQPLKEAANIIGQVGSSLSELAGSLAEVSPELSAVLQGMADVSSQAQDTINAVVSFASGDIAGGVTSLVSAVSSIIEGFAKAAESKRQAQAEILDFQSRVKAGEIEYNRMLRERELQTIKLNKTTIDGLEAQKKLLLEQQVINKTTFEKVLEQLQQEEFISGEHTKRRRGGALSGLVGFFSGTRTTIEKELSSLAGKTFEEIEKLFTQGQLTDKAKSLFEQLQQLKQEGTDVDALLVQNAIDFKEALTGTTSDSITDSIIEGFKAGKRGAADFADTFQDLMRNAILQSLKLRFLEEPLKEFFDEFAAASDSGDQLTASEIEQLHTTFNDIISNASSQFEQLQSIADLNLAAGSGPGTNSLSGAIKGITENQAELLAGQFGGLRLTALDHLNVSKSSLNVLMDMNNQLVISIQRWDRLLTKFDNYETGIKKLHVNVA